MPVLDTPGQDKKTPDFAGLTDPHGNRPIRAELYGLEHLEQHARALAEGMKQTTIDIGRPLINRFLQNARALKSAHRTIRHAYEERETLGHDADWLLDNYHIIAETLAEIRTDLPQGYYGWLPKLMDGPLRGYPRVYAMALELVAHTDSCLDENNLFRFVQAFQTQVPLTVGELWAVPIMLRLCVFDNLSRLAQEIVLQRQYRQEAEIWVRNHIGAIKDLTEPQLAFASLHPDWWGCYVVHILEGLYEQELTYPQALQKLQNSLENSGQSVAGILSREKDRQAANQVSIGNCVTSLRVLSALDWTQFFERCSLLEVQLRTDPAGTYPRQDFRTRDRYRQIIEHLARRSKYSELEVVGFVLEFAQKAGETDLLRRHVGYYLLDQGRGELEKRIQYRPPLSHWLRRRLLAHPNTAYFSVLTLLTAVFLIAIGLAAAGLGASTGLVILLLVVAVVPASELSVGLLNLLVPALIPPRILPRLEHQTGVPESCPTFVVIPSLLNSPQTAANLIERLETHYLSNPDEEMYFGLLTDFVDASSETMPADEGSLKTAQHGIQTLNEKYAQAGKTKFFLFHRRRIWNPDQGCWMGWERKRGKLAEFNELILHQKMGSFSTIVGDPASLPRIRFVITLDSDTQLPREAARKLIATLAHPLNRPYFDASRGRVVRGYGVLQPRIGLSLRGARKSLFARIYSGSAGLDPYTTAVSDTYQDLFGSGSFTGKGIYDLDAFESATGQVFPENRILSHDLIEGNFARCGLVSDVELLDDFPSHYQAYARREHRWVRGDWQLLGWLFPSVSGKDGQKKSNPLPLLERWKIFDNLRRSLVAPTLAVLLILAWTILPRTGWWTGFVALVLAWPLCLTLFVWPFRTTRHLIAGAEVAPPVSDWLSTLGQVFLSAIFLLEQSVSMVDAIVRTLYRLLVSKRLLLEWESAAVTEIRLKTTAGHFLKTMWLTPVLAVGLACLLFLAFPSSLWAASPFLVGWFFAPLVALWVSLPSKPVEVLLSADEQAHLRRWARKTWSFFETFVVEEDHWLPPDNYQEDPKNEVAHRTSPTNIGLYLVSCVSAHDLGYLGLPALLDRLEKTIRTIETMERAHGHLYNWYDTQTLAPLPPIYLSTVDSGNFAVSLITLRQALLEKMRSPFWSSAVSQGLLDTLQQVNELMHLQTDLAKGGQLPALESRIQSLQLLLANVPNDFSGCTKWIDQLHGESSALGEEVLRVNTLQTSAGNEWVIWTERLADLARQRAEEFKLFCLREESSPTGLTDLTLDQLAAQARPVSIVEGLDPPELRKRCQALADKAGALAAAMDFKLLYNQSRELFAVGYNLSAGRIDGAHYDLLASESALTSFLAVARGDVSKKHWFQLGRPLTRIDHSLVLLSWGGTMFEYLMPSLFLNLFQDTLLAESQRGAVWAQIQYGRQCRAPWGVSESAYNAVDGNWNYQYQAFGVPGLGLRRGLSQDLVVAPYATGLAVMIAPKEAIRNSRRLTQEGAEGRYGFYEAIDFTADRIPQNRPYALVKCFMAHHQGMTLLALVNCLMQNCIRNRFHAEPMVRATELLLQERVPNDPAIAEQEATESTFRPSFQESSPQLSRRITTPHTAHPRLLLLASEKYSLMITNAGSGQSLARGLAVTRWREDRTCDSWGQFFYVRDLRTGNGWSAGYQPLCVEADEYEVTFATDKAVFRRIDGHIETRMEVTISPENHTEVRRLTFTNHDSRSHYLEVTSYAELVLMAQSGDLAHPAFGKLFLETEFIPNSQALLCHRRPRAADEKPLWALHVLAVEGKTFGPVQYETDRARFLGRGRSPADPVAFETISAPLSGTTGPVLDAIFSLRRRARIKAGTSVSFAFATSLVNSREEALALADHYHDYHGVNRAFELAWAHAQVELRQLHLSASDTHLFQRLAAHLWYAGSALRAASNIQAANRQGQSGLWRHRISGDLPIILAYVADSEGLSLARQLITAHWYLRLRGLSVDLIIVNEEEGGYFEEVQQQLQALVRASEDRALIDKPGGVYLRKSSNLSPEDGLLFMAAAHCVLLASRGNLSSQLDRLERQPNASTRRPHAVVVKDSFVAEKGANALPSGSRLFENGIGGFTPDGKEYVVDLKAVNGEYKYPPQPWINVLANPEFGTIVSESGGGYTWAGNSQSNRLTPWQNDPVWDRAGEIIYLNDEKTGQLWSATPQPVGSPVDFSVRHGQGYSIFEHTRANFVHELTIFVARHDPVKIFRLKIRNLEDRGRRVNATFYVEWVLGRSRDRMNPYIVTAIEPETGALTARSAFRPDYADHIAFTDVNVRPRTFTADRTEFLGRNGSIAAPAAFQQGTLSGKLGAGLDPCSAIRTTVIIPSRGEKEIIFVLGEASDLDEVKRLVQKYQDPARVQAAWEEWTQFWNGLLSAVVLRSPSPELDLLFNRWLPYQILSCRMWGRSALYQSGGAFGFRDQLQDCMAMVYAFPEESRRYCVRAAGRQFIEGDVQHWWHPPTGAGIRTRFCDDYLWLAFVVEHYVRVTGDRSLLDEQIAYLEAPLLKPGEEESYTLPTTSAEKATVYEHCLRAIDHGLRFGVHGLPLMGTGDWNDGMNLVGVEGKGESVWAGWFLLTILRSFSTICDSRADFERSAHYREQADQLLKNLEANAWDGGWYRRAYFDDGTPLGSTENDECRIDSLPQSWAVISGAARPDRVAQAMQAVEQQLVKKEEKLVLLFTPPFDHGKLQPGYIKGYVPGIRENGGQYTHGSMWVAQAFALMGHGDKAAELLELMNPILHTSTPQGVERFRLEPYVLPGDVYSQSQYVGRGGWSWYTGSAGWYYRVVLETLLGFQLHGNILKLSPRIPASWTQFELSYRYRSTIYRIRIENNQGGNIIAVMDGKEVPGAEFSLVDDGIKHELSVRLARIPN